MSQSSAPASSVGAKVFLALREVLGILPLTVLVTGLLFVSAAAVSAADTREILDHGRTDTAKVIAIREWHSSFRGSRSVSYCPLARWSEGTRTLSGELPCTAELAQYGPGDQVAVRYLQNEPDRVLDMEAIPDERWAFAFGGLLIAIGLPLTILSARDAQRRARRRRDIRRARRDGRILPARHLATSDD